MDYDSVVLAKANEVIHTKLGLCPLPLAGGNRGRVHGMFSAAHIETVRSCMLYQLCVHAYGPPVTRGSWEQAGYPALTCGTEVASGSLSPAAEA